MSERTEGKRDKSLETGRYRIVKEFVRFSVNLVFGGVLSGHINNSPNLKEHIVVKRGKRLVIFFCLRKIIV